MRARLITSCLVLAALLAPSGPAVGALPRRIAFQGRLTDATGAPLTGLYEMRFRILDSATAGTGNQCHGETQQVLVTSGIFNVFVGAGADDGRISDECTFDRPYFLEIAVGGDDAMEPRIPFVAAPYALVAERLYVETNTGDPCPTKAWPAGNQLCNVAVSNRGLNQRLNADTWNGKHVADIDREVDQCQGIVVAPGGTCEITQLGLTMCSTSCGGADPAPACPSGCTDLGERCVIAGYGSCFNYLHFAAGEVQRGKVRHCQCPATPYGHFMRAD